ncbi:MAG TPA: PBP1A family penicillin-binding protein [Pyrinomonadaceae bacterium]|jgi:penicillin-binding protein 1B
MAIEITSEHTPRRPRIIKGMGRAARFKFQTEAEYKRKLILRCITAALFIAFGFLSAFLIHSYFSYSQIVDERLAHGYLTSRAGIYAAPRTLRAGQTLKGEELISHLRRAGYVETSGSEVWSGSFTAVDQRTVEIRPRRLSANAAVPDVVRVRLDKKGRIDELTGDEVTLDSFTLEPEVLTNDAALKVGQRATLAYKDIPPVLVHAIISIEDRRFFDHSGVDLFGIGRALLRNAGDNEVGQGGSTITQQLVKNTYLSPKRTLRRKFAEAMLAFTLERRLSKEDIFALYCNEVYLGQRGAVGVRGVEQAARIYFGKDLKDLSLHEAATIAGMIQSPVRYAPERHAEESLARRNTVLGTMVRDGWITVEQAAAASKEPLQVAPFKESNNSLAPYFVDYVNRIVESGLERGLTKDERGLRIYTTIDLDLQQLAEAAVRRQLERLDKVYKGRKATPQAALVALDPQTGAVLAMVGGRDYADSQLNRATDALRQPGSVFKPIVYAAALESGLSPVSLFADAPREFAYDCHSIYRPANFGGTYSMHDVTMRTGLIKSLNVVTVDVAMRTGLLRVAETARKFGLSKPEAYPALALGTTEATPLQMAAAYTTFVNAGQRIDPEIIAHIDDATGAPIVNPVPTVRRVLTPATAYIMTDMLTGVVDHGTARAARGQFKRTAIAGKTGTSRDGWFVGYTPNMVVAVWVGFDDNKQLGLTGAEAALPAWTEFVKGAVELRPELGGEVFEHPAGVAFVEIDPETGMLATEGCPQRERIAITAALAPQSSCYLHTASYPMVAALDQEDYYESISQQDETQDANIAPPSSSRRALPAPRTPAAVDAALETAEPPPARTTRVERDRRGRSVLTSEMGMP